MLKCCQTETPQNDSEETAPILKTSTKQKCLTKLEKITSVSKLGVLLALLHGFTNSFLFLEAKVLSNYSAFFINSSTKFIRLWFVIPVSIRKKENPFPKEKLLLLIMRGVCGCFFNNTKYAAPKYLPIGDITALVSTNTVIVLIIGKIFFNEPVSFVHIFGCLSALSGIILIAQPSFIFGSQTVSIIGVALSLSSALTSAVSILLARKLKDVPTNVKMVSSLIIDTAGSGILLFATSSYKPLDSYIDLVYILAMAVTAHLVHTLILLATRYVDAGVVTTLQTVDIFFAFVWDVLFFSTSPNTLSYIGSGLIVIAVYTISMYWWLEKP